VRRATVLGIVLLSFGSAATAAPRDITVQVSQTEGGAPLTVTLTAVGAADSFHWDLGDGTSADGRSVQHTYQAGHWTATLTARSGTDTLTRTASVTAYGLSLAGPARARYARKAAFRGALVPADAGKTLTISGPAGAAVKTRTRANGTFVARVRVTHPGTWTAALGDVTASEPLQVDVVPQLRTGLVGSGARGGRLLLAASVRPRGAGSLAVSITRSGSVIIDKTFSSPVRLKLDTRRLSTYRIKVAVDPSEGFTRAVHVLRAAVVLPRLAYGSRGSTVAQLASRLHELHYATPSTASFDSRLLDTVYAFQKVQDLPRTGVVDAAFWRRLGSPRVPVARYAQPASHIEIDKPHQVLYVVRAGKVALIVPVSTAGLPGRFTPVGRFSIYRKVTGFDPSPLGTLFDPMYFTGGYAIHGNPSVPPYPASHGCVRVPMWIAPYLYDTNPYGETVDVY
jgi:lipoprotein-anchoring transpeptidase ErfK/SrfK